MEVQNTDRIDLSYKYPVYQLLIDYTERNQVDLVPLVFAYNYYIYSIEKIKLEDFISRLKVLADLGIVTILVPEDSKEGKSFTFIYVNSLDDNGLIH